MTSSEQEEHGLARLLFVSRTADLGISQQPVAEFFGGVHYGWLGRADNPFFQSAKFEVYPLGIRISPRWALVNLFVPLWEARFDELVEIRECRHASLPAIRFVTSNHRLVHFWASRACLREVARALRACGVEWVGADGAPTRVQHRPG